MSGWMRRVGLAAGTLLLATAAAGCAGDGPAADDLAASAGVTVEASAGSTTAAPTPAAAPVEQGLGRGPTPTPSKTTTPKPKPKAPPKPVAARDIPPPLAPEPVSPDCTGPKYVGTQASRAAARDALVAAANTVYWPTSAPEIKVPVDLVKAVAWQESGWQSNIVACDGGIGLMQVMPGTAKQINDRFGESYGINDYRDNAKLGANYLAWLVKYLGDLSGLGYRIDSGDCVDHTDPCLLNAVISAYNMGPGTVLVEKPDGTYDLKVSNIRYVDNVRTLMTECECLGF